MTDREQRELIVSKREISAAQLLASSLDPRRPNFAQQLEQQIDQGGNLEDVLLSPENSLVKSTEYLFQIEPQQFSSIAQPYVEAIINEAEAARADGRQVTVDVTLDLQAITIKGNGKGMDFKKNFVGQVVRPHSGDEGKVRGQFGQGTKSYWLAGENVTISSVPENPDSRGFDVSLKNNSQDKSKGKSIAVELKKPQSNSEPGTTVVFEQPRANGKPVTKDDLQYIADYIHKAVEHVYFAKINLTVDGKSEVVNKRALEAPRYKSGEVEVIVIPTKESAPLDARVLSAIDVAGESLWQESDFSTAEQLVINFPRQRMKAEARSFNHLSLLEEDQNSVENLIQQLIDNETSPLHLAKCLSSISRQLDQLSDEKIQFSEAKKSLSNELSKLAESKVITLFPAWPGTEGLLFSEKTVLVGETVSALVPENLRTNALQKVEFADGPTMFASAFQSARNDEFFMRIGPAACVNIEIFEKAKTQSTQVKNSLRTALNTSLIHYNYTHPLAAEQIKGRFTSTDYVQFLTSAELSSTPPSPETTLVDRSVIADGKPRDEDLATLLPRALESITPAEFTSAVLTEQEQSVVEKLTNRDSWEDKMTQFVTDEFDVYTSLLTRVLKMKDGKIHVEEYTEAELLDAFRNMWGDLSERALLEKLVEGLKPDQLVKQTENSYIEIFSDFLLFCGEKDENTQKSFKKLLEYVDSEPINSKFDQASNTGGHFGSILLLWLSGNEAEYLNLNEYRFQRSGVTDRAKFVNDLHNLWAEFAKEKPEQVKLLRLGLLTYHVAQSNDVQAARRSLLENDSVRALYAQDTNQEYSLRMQKLEEKLRRTTNKLHPKGYTEEEIQKKLQLSADAYFYNQQKPVEHVNTQDNLARHTICDSELVTECKENSLDFLAIYQIVQSEFQKERAHGYEDTHATATAALDQTIALISYLRENVHVSISEIVLTHQNCLKLGVPSILVTLAKDQTRFASDFYRSNNLNFQSLYFFEVLGKERDEKKLAILGAVIHQLAADYSSNPATTDEIYKRLMIIGLPLLQVFSNENEISSAAELILQIAKHNELFKVGDLLVTDKLVTDYLYLFALQPEAFPIFQKLMQKDSRVLPILVFLMDVENLPALSNTLYRYRPEMDPGVVFVHLAVAEKLLSFIPSDLDLSTLKKRDSQVVVISEGKETVIETGDFRLFESLKEKTTLDEEWQPPTDGSAIEGDLVELTAVYLSLKADDKDLTQFTPAEIAEMTNKMKQNLSDEQRKYYQRRLISTIQSQDSNPYRFYKEWYQNSQNAALGKNEKDRFAVTMNGLSTDKKGQVRRFTKLLDFNGMSSDKAIWNLGTSPGFKEGDADQKSLERFHAGWLTSLNGAAEVRVKTSTGNGKVLYRRFLPIYEQDGSGRKLIQVKQQTWEVLDSQATTPFTDMTRYEVPTEKNIFENPLESVMIDAARYHDLTELATYEVSDNEHFVMTDTDLSLAQVSQLHDGVRSMHHIQLGDREETRTNLFMQSWGNDNQPLVRKGEWGFDVVGQRFGEGDLLVQGGFALGDHWPAELTRLIPPELLQAFHEKNEVMILRIPKDVAPNKARDSINNAAAFIEENKSFIAGLLVEAVAEAIAQQLISEKVLLSYDAGEDFMTRYPLRDQKSRQTVTDLASGKKDAGAVIFDSENPGREISKLALHLPLFRLPKLLPGIPESELKREYSLFDLMVIRSGAAYLLQYEMKNNDSIGKLIEQLVEKNEFGQLKKDADGTMILSQDALVRMAWMARPETQLANRARLAKFMIQEKLEENPLWQKMQDKVKVLSALGKFVRRRKNEADQTLKPEKDGHVPLTAEATKEEIAALFTGEGKKHIQLASEVNAVLQVEKNANVLPIVTLKRNQKPKEDEKAYFGLARFTVDAVNAIDPKARFTTENIGYYTEADVVSRARAGGRVLGFNVADVQTSNPDSVMTTQLFKTALDKDDMSILVSKNVGATIAHEAAHNQESKWSETGRTDNTTHDLTFRRMEEANFRKLTKALFDTDQTGVAKIQTMWQDLRSQYDGTQMVAGNEFYKRLSR